MPGALAAILIVALASGASAEPVPVSPTHEAIASTLGLYQDEAIGRLLQEVGTKIAAESRNPGRPWSFWLIDDPAINVFSVPPAAVYLTRGLFLYLDSEAELATILAHAVAHLDEGHVPHELADEELWEVGLGLSSRADEALHHLTPLATSHLDFLTAAFRPGDDHKADDLAFRGLERAGYDLQAPGALYTVLEQLEGVDLPGRIPGWWQTHPGPENRAKRAAREAATFPRGSRPGETGRERFLPYLQDLVFGPNLDRPYLVGNRYFNPAAGFRLDLPVRWKATHLAGGILAASREGDAMLQVSPTDATSNVDALRAFFNHPDLDPKRSWRHSVNNLSSVWATFDVRRKDRNLEGRIGFVTVDETVYRLLGVGLERLWLRHFTDVQEAFESIRRIKATATEEAIGSARIELLEMEDELSLGQLEEAFPSATTRRHVRLLNRLSDGRRTSVGELFKHVYGGLDAVVEEEEGAADLDSGEEVPRR